MYDYFLDKWEDILNNLKQEYDISEVSFKTWLTPIHVHSVNDNIITLIYTGEPMGLQYIKKKYYTPLKVTIEEYTGQEFDIKIILADQADSIDTDTINSSLEEKIKAANLNSKYTFDTFVVGANNNIAHAAALAAAESPAEDFNPLFIYGGVGLGKTHLMHSVGNFILRNNPDAKVIYVNSETFTNELIDIFQNKSGNQSAITEFRNKYRNVDVLLIDDIQFIIGKERTQEEFFHTLNSLYMANRQIIISSDKPPKDFKILEPRLRSRFNEGFTVDIQSPDYETRMAILRKKAENESYNINDEVFQYIANNIKSNIRELEGALNKITFYSKLSSQDITLELAQDVLKDFISPSDDEKKITSQLVVSVVAEHFGITTEDILSKKKNQEVAYPRQICMYLCRQLTDDNLKEIASAVGKKDHTTISYGVNKIRKDMLTNPSTKSLIEVITKKINPN
ncbi:MAG: chromosomal replication initiator protein DnaA [Eubacterium sp.]